jgi:hypothetical protein
MRIERACPYGQRDEFQLFEYLRTCTDKQGKYIELRPSSVEYDFTNSGEGRKGVEFQRASGANHNFFQ